MSQLTDADDDVLDASLNKLWADHAAAMKAGDTQTRAEVHWAIQQILDEQSRRLDAWIAEHTVLVSECGPEADVPARRPSQG